MASVDDAARFVPLKHYQAERKERNKTLYIASDPLAAANLCHMVQRLHVHWARMCTAPACHLASVGAACQVAIQDT